MTKEEAARILDPETTRDELLEFDASTYPEACNEACCMGAAALREQLERENPKPLTLDELRKMGGEPIWVRFIDGVVEREPGWYVFPGLVKQMIHLMGVEGEVFKHIDNYGKTWLAYSHKQKEGQK